MSRWWLGASIAGGFGGGFGAGYIHTSGGRGRYEDRFLRAPRYRSEWGGGPNEWGRHQVGMGISFTVSDIGAFFRNLFHSEPDVAANGPQFYPPNPVHAAGGYQGGGTLNGIEWRPYADGGEDTGRQSHLVQQQVVGLNPHARQRPVSIAADRVTADLPTAPPDVVAVDLMRHPELTLNMGDVTRRAVSTISNAPAANGPGYLGRPDLQIGNS